MPESFEPSQAFSDFVILTLDQGFKSIADGGGPLVPFVFEIAEDGTRDLTRFVKERLEDGLEAARRYVDESVSHLTMYAIAWDGYLTDEKTRTDAILVEAADRADEKGVLFAQQYKAVRNGLRRQRVCERIGDPLLLRSTHSRFRGSSASGVIDLVSQNAAGDEVTLHLIVEEPWDDGGDATGRLHNRLKNYVAFAADGPLHSKFPETVGMRVSIHIRTKYPLGWAENKLVEMALEQWCKPEQIELVVTPLNPD